MTEANVAAASEPTKTAPIKPTWICLIVAWILFLLPIPGVGVFIGWPLNLVAFILAIVIMSKGFTQKGLIPLLASLIVSPIIYFIGVSILAGVALSSAADQGTAQAQPAAAHRAAPAITITAKSLFAAYDANEVAADSEYKGQLMQISGIVDSIASDIMDEPDVLLRAGAFQSVHAQGLSTAAAAGLSKGEPVTLVCTGAGEVMGSPMLEDCSLQ